MWSIQEVSRLTGVTSRALRHYGDLGLLRPSRTGAGGLRYYDGDALVRLQRILLLRDLGLGLTAIGEVLDGHRDDIEALRTHLEVLREQRDRLDRRIASVTTTIDRLREGEHPMAEQMFDGFDHTAHREEVTERWGAAAYASSDAWWRSMTDTEKKDWQDAQRALAEDWRAAAHAGLDPAGSAALALAARHATWLAGIPGTPGYPDGPSPEYLTGLGEMYVADPRFAANYGDAAPFVRDALAAFARTL